MLARCGSCKKFLGTLSDGSLCPIACLSVRAFSCPADLAHCAQQYKQFRAAAFGHMRALLQHNLDDMVTLFRIACEEMKNEFEDRQHRLIKDCTIDSALGTQAADGHCGAADLVSVRVAGDSVSVSLRNCFQSIGRTQYTIRADMYNKLRRQFLACSTSTDFESSLWCMLHRYQALMGPSGMLFVHCTLLATV